MSEGFKKLLFLRLRLIWIVIYLLTGIGAGPSWGQDFEKTLSVLITTSKSAYSREEPIKLSLKVTNISNHPVNIPFASAKQYDFVVTLGGKEVWRWSEDQLFAMVLTHIIMGPNETRRFETTWFQTDRNGQKVQPGLYEASGTLEILNHPLSSSTSLQIE